MSTTVTGHLVFQVGSKGWLVIAHFTCDHKKFKKYFVPPGLVLSWTTSRGANVLIWHRPKGEIGKLLGRTSISAPPPWLGTAQNLLWCCVICFSVQTELKRCLHSYQVMKHKTRIIEAGSTYIKDDTSRIKDELKALEVSVKLRSRYSIWMSLTKCKYMSQMPLTFVLWEALF